MKRLVLFTIPTQGVDQQLGSGSSMLQFVFGDALLVGSRASPKQHENPIIITDQSRFLFKVTKLKKPNSRIISMLAYIVL